MIKNKRQKSKQNIYDFYLQLQNMSTKYYRQCYTIIPVFQRKVSALCVLLF